jgi:hypothetical protein
LHQNFQPIAPKPGWILGLVLPPTTGLGLGNWAPKFFSLFLLAHQLKTDHYKALHTLGFCKISFLFPSSHVRIWWRNFAKVWLAFPFFVNNGNLQKYFPIFLKWKNDVIKEKVCEVSF